MMSRRKALLPHLEGITYIHDELGKARTSALGKWWPGDPKYLVKTQLKDYFTGDTRGRSDLKRRRETAERRTLQSSQRLRPGGLWDCPGRPSEKGAESTCGSR